MRPDSRIIAGIEASMMKSLGTCRPVMPLSELTMARAGRFAYSAAMSSLIAFFSASGSVSIFVSRSPKPLLRLTPSFFSVAACFSITSAKKTETTWPNTIGIGDLHHRRLDVQREQHALLLGVVDLLGEEGAQRLAAHHRRVDDLAGLERRLGLQHRESCRRRSTSSMRTLVALRPWSRFPSRSSRRSTCTPHAIWSPCSRRPSCADCRGRIA